VSKTLKILSLVFLGVFFVAPVSAYAETYRLYNVNWSGLYGTVVATITGGNTFTYANGGVDISEVLSLDTGYLDGVHVIGRLAYANGGPGTGTNLESALSVSSQPPGNYFAIGTSGGGEEYCFFTWDGTNVDASDCETPPDLDTGTTYHYTCSDWSFEGDASCTDDIVSATNGGNYDGPPHFDLGAGTWYVSYDLEGTVIVNCAGAGCSGAGTGTHNTGEFVDDVVVSGGTQGLYFHSAVPYEISNICISDTVGVCVPGAGPEEPTSDLNEVIRYWPNVGVSTTTGTTTVGAQFSIAHPEWIVGVGYKLLGYDGTVLYDASTTVASANLFSLTVDYNFTTPGVVYTGHAYFIQEVDGNLWYVDNPSIQQISIDNPLWSVDPNTGRFIENSATTSTSTVSGLTLNCGTGFAGSVCNLVANLMIPKPGSLSMISSANSNLMSKAPFSFFVQAKTVLDSLQIVSAAEPASLALTLFGAETDVISTSTANSVGLNSTVINGLKLLMSIGLWLLLAWYLYWRIPKLIPQ